MANEDKGKRTIEIPNEVTLDFTYRKDGEQLKENALQAKVVVDLSALTADDFCEWAFSNMVIGYQSKLRSKKPPTAEADGSYKWKAPARGSRSVQDPAKLDEAATKLVGKMDAKQKQHLLYTTLLSIGKSAAEATAISGYVPDAK